MKNPKQTSRKSGYTLVEMLMAAVIMATAVAAAASLSLTMVTQEEVGHRVARALNLHETAARLFQLGLAPNEITALLPPDPVAGGIVFSTGTFTHSEGGVTMLEAETATSTLTYYTTPDNGTWVPGTWTAGSDTSRPTRTSTIVSLRPVIR